MSKTIDSEALSDKAINNSRKPFNKYLNNIFIFKLAYIFSIIFLIIFSINI